MYLGIDTSCYTTSAAIINDDYKLITEKRILLDVKLGNRGLRQSEAVFQHLKNMPLIFNSLSNVVDMNKIKNISVSYKPRTSSYSYMPVFVCGESFANTLASCFNIPLNRFSHQEGHIMSALWDIDMFGLLESNFIVFHISGGTTELLKVSKENNKIDINIIGGTKDISAGQLIDRTGVILGMKFPSGIELEECSLKGKPLKMPVCVEETWVNFSGPEHKTIKLIEDGYAKEDVCRSVIECICLSVEKVLEEAIKKTGINNIVMVGGVCSNSILKKHLGNIKNANIYFAKPDFSRDNAVGIAVMGKYFS